MGLAMPLLRFLAREHRRQAFAGSVLLLGRQCVYATLDEVRGMLREERVSEHSLPVDFPTGSNVTTWQGTPQQRNTSDAAFFQLLGVDHVTALDVSDFEGAEIVCDLNHPVPSALHDRFDLIVDSGTLEHVFHIPQALKNVALMLRTGGRALHFSPSNNYTNHGFYQISPTLYVDFYQANQFSDVRVFIAEQSSHRDPSARLDVFEFDKGHTEILMSHRRLLTLAIASKTDASTSDRIPMQGYYATIHGPQSRGVQTAEEKSRSLASRMKRYVPTGLKTLARRCVRGMDPNWRPWRLRRWGRLS